MKQLYALDYFYYCTESTVGIKKSYPFTRFQLIVNITFESSYFIFHYLHGTRPILSHYINIDFLHQIR